MDLENVKPYIGKIVKIKFSIDHDIKAGKLYMIPGGGNRGYFIFVYKLLFGLDAMIYPAKSFESIELVSPGDKVYDPGSTLSVDVPTNGTFDAALRTDPSTSFSYLRSITTTEIEDIIDQSNGFRIPKIGMSKDGNEIDTETGELTNPTGRFKFL